MRQLFIGFASAIAVAAGLSSTPVAAESPVDPAVNAIKSFYAALVDVMKRGKELGLSLYTPVIIKYRDEKTDQAVRLEDLLR